MIKKIAKDYIGPFYSKFDYPLLVNSYGRSGSTVLTKSIFKCSTITRNKRISGIISHSAWDLESSDLKGGIIYKTHDYPPLNFRKDIRMIYSFANPVDVVLSLLRLNEERGEEWMKKHYNHLKVPFTCFSNIIKEDQLRIEKHLNSWLNEERIPIAFIKYETMWDYQGEISDFLGFKVQLPPFEERKTNQVDDYKLINKLINTYRTLIKKVNNLDNFFVKN